MQNKHIFIAVFLSLCLFVFPLAAQTPTQTADKIPVTIKGYTNGKTLNLFESQTLTATVDQSIPSPDTVVLECDDARVCTTAQDAADKSKWTITVPANSNTREASITVKRSASLADHSAPVIDGQSTGKIPVKVYRIVPPGDKTIIHINETKVLSSLLGLDRQIVIDSLNVSPKTGAINYNTDVIKGVSAGNGAPGDGTLDIVPKVGEFDTQAALQIPIDVVPADLTVKIENKGAKLKGNVKEKVAVAAKVFDANGNALTKETGEIKWELKDPADQDKVNIRELGGGQAEIDILKPSDSTIILEAKLKDKDIKDSIALFTEPELNVVGFGNIEMRLNMVDERTAKDLFGGQSTADYMVAKLRIFNKVPPNQNGGPSSSILFFSEGFEVNVGLEKKVIDPKRNGSSGDKGWQPITYQDIEFINSWVYIPAIDDNYIRYLFKRDLPCAGLKETLGIKTCEIDDSSLNRLQYFYEKSLCANNENCKNEVAKKNWTPFRPHAFLIVAGTHERRSERSVRERVLRIANGAVSAGSFATAFASTTNNTGYTFGFDKYSNLLVPAFEKLFPSRREVQRKNILDLALQPYEEVSYGREVSKMVFIPRKPIPGVLPNYDVRIVTVSVSKMKAEVSIVQKQKVATQ